MKSRSSSVGAALALAFGLGLASPALAQNATVALSSQKQYIRGFGGISHAAWAGDLNASERDIAFKSGTGQLGFSILRIPVTDGKPDSVNVNTAKAAAAAGAIVFASPWNAATTYTSAQFASYATHLRDFVTYMKNQGVNLYAISVQNEPDYGGEAGWGSWTAAACHDFVARYGNTLGTKLISCESFNYAKSYYDPILNDAATLAKVDIFGTHLYGTPVSGYVHPLLDSNGAGKERWMTEHYTDSSTDANVWPNALGVATELHDSMVTGQFNAYVWWYIKRFYGPINNGAITKRGGCMGQWSKFVRPGFHRVDATEKPAVGLSLSAYKKDTSVVVVVVNTNNSARNLNISIPGANITSFAKYTTSSSKTIAKDGNVTARNGSLSTSVDASSVTSFVGTGTTGGGGAGGGGAGGGGAGGGGAGGTGGSAGAAGAVSGGAAGAAVGGTVAGGAGSGGVATGGAGGAAAGGASNGGATTMAGSVAVAGHAASAGKPASGGSSSVAGSAAQGGSSTAGSSTTDGATADDAEGCSCRAAGGDASPASSLKWLSLSMLGAALLGRRRRQATSR